MAEETTYLVQRKLALEDLGVKPAEAGSADSLGAVRSAFGKLGDAWIDVGEATAGRPREALEKVIGPPEDATSGTYRTLAKRYVGEPQPITKEVKTTLIFGTTEAATAPAKCQPRRRETSAT